MAEYGRRLLPSFIDQVASSSSDQVFARIPKTLHVQDGLRSVTFRDLAKAIDKCAWWVKRTLGDGKDFSTITYVGPHDLRYLFLAVGACKAGFKMFFASPRNSTAALLVLLDEVNCNVLLLPNASTVSRTLQEATAGRPMDLFDFPELSYFLDNTQNTRAFVWHKTFDEAKHDPLAVFHTSGSTGTPRPVVVSHGAVAALDAFRKIPLLSGKMVQTSYHAGRTTLLLFPMFHASALATLFLSIWNQIPTILPPPLPLTADLASEMLVACKPEVSIVPPSLLVDIAANQRHLKNLLKCHHVQYGGGPVPTGPGDLIAAGTHLVTVFGSSETGFFPVEINDGKDWAYVKLSPYAGGEFRQHAEDVYELVIVRNEKLVEFQPIFWTYPQLGEYHTRDLFSKHPSKPDLWLWQGRIDDLIVLGNGEKFNPIDVETTINGHRAVDAALICGQGRTQCALLLELSAQSGLKDTSNSLLEDLWPIIQQAQIDCPEYALLTREMILSTGPVKKMIRTDKGTVRRQMTINHFSSELDTLYRNAEEQDGPARCVVLPFDVRDTENAILKVVRDTPKFTDIGADENFFTRGLDSLHAMTIARRVRAAFPNTSNKITNKAVYDFPSVRRLARYVSGPNTAGEDAVGEMQRLYDRYSSVLPKEIEGSSKTPVHDKVVLLTGSTGNLGGYLLEQLLHDDDVAAVYCLNRGSEAEQRQSQSRSPRHSSSVFSKHVVFVQVDYSLPRLGIPEFIYAVLLANITHIIHNAWPVDFLLRLPAFEPNIKSVVDLVELSSASANAPPVTFISSVGTVLNQSTASPIPEKTCWVWHASGETGYTQSKLIAERLLTTASSNLGLQTTICRVCQLAGALGSKSAWPEKEWIPAMMKTSQRLGFIPRGLGALDTVNWLPVDTAAAVIRELAFRSGLGHPSTTFHVVNPRTVPWEDVIPATPMYAKLGKISLTRWLDRLEHAAENDNAEDIPASSSIGFFRGLCAQSRVADLDTSEAVKFSATLVNASPITRAQMEKWFEGERAS